MSKWKVFFDFSCVSKLGETTPVYNSNTRPSNLTLQYRPYILISHKTGGEVQKHLSEFLVNDELPQGEVLCYISAAEQCGLSEKEVSTIESKYKNRVHIYKGAIPNIDIGGSPSNILVQRFENFISATSGKDASESPVWDLLYPERYPDELLAVHLFMTAQKMGVSLQSSTLTENVWSKAGQQFYERGGTSSCIQQSNWKGASAENLASCLSDIRNLFMIMDSKR